MYVFCKGLFSIELVNIYLNFEVEIEFLLYV